MLPVSLGWGCEGEGEGKEGKQQEWDDQELHAAGASRWVGQEGYMVRSRGCTAGGFRATKCWDKVGPRAAPLMDIQS